MSNEKQTNSMRVGGAIALFIVSFGLGLLTGAFTIDTESSSPHWSKLEKVDIDGDRSVFGVISISLSSDGKRMAVGDPVYGNDGGRVQVYQREGSDWKPMGQTLIGEQSTEFGFSVAMSNDGNVVAVGARPVDSLFTDGLFSFMEVYKYTGTEWRLMGDTIFHSSDGFCGQSVTISGNGNRAAMLCSNTIRVVDFDGTSWNLLNSSDIPSSSSTKIALSSDGDVLASESFILDFNGTEWISRDASLLEEGADVKDFAFSGDSSTIAASFVYGGVPQQTVTTKAFHFSGIGWKQLGQNIEHESTAGNIEFARVTLSMDGRAMAISSSDWGMQGKSGRGTVRLYSYNGTMWNLRGHPLGQDEYGVFMDLSGDGAVVAAYSYGRGTIENGAISSYSYGFN
jgi:hypothetical protein